ncbi:MAG: DUF4982 domain-containing protein [Acidobacteria bacterium]|nr:DUF4982 domain-containing protein [Acidobacteriota bacterium]
MLSKSIFAFAQDGTSPHIVDRITLTDGWEFLKDSLANPWEAWLTDQTNPLTKVSLPHCFNAMDACDPDVPYYQGPGWYRTHVQINNPFPNGRTLLHFEGAGQESKVYVGLELAGEHIGGYDEFVLDITELAAKHTDYKRGVPLAVMCTNAHNLDRIPSQMSDFTLYGGLYRNVHVVYVPEASIAHVKVETDIKEGGRSCSVNIVPNGYFPADTVPKYSGKIEIFGPDNELLHRSDSLALTKEDAKQLGNPLIVHNVKLWSPDSPNLYRCRVTLQLGAGTQVVEERFGCRSFHFEEHGAFFLNGKKCFLRGTHRHEDHAGYGAATPAAIIRKEMQLIKEMGANFIRLAHYQQSKLVLDLCDELGLIVWEEVPWCRAGAGSEKMQQMVLDKLRIMIEQHGNHPSIVFWGLGNEDDWPGEYPSINKEEIRVLMQRAHELAHKLDPTRLTSYRRCDFARDIPDVYSPSIWAGWYGGSYTDYQKSLETQNKKQKHMLHIEWGADSHAGRHAEKVPLVEIPKDETTAETGMAFKMTGGSPRMSKDGDWSETYACDLFDWHLKVQEILPWFAGSAQWIFKDFTTPLRPENPVPRINQKGVAARDLTLKESYYVFQSYWARKPMVHIYGHTWAVRWGKPDEEKTIKVYSNCVEVELFVNGRSAGKKKRNSQDFPAAGLRWQVALKPGKNEVRAVGSTGQVEDQISFNYETESWGAPHHLRIIPAISFSGNVPQHFAIAEVLDAAGKICHDARNRLTFSVSGAARLVDNLGTPWGSRVVEAANGRAVVHLADVDNISGFAVSVNSAGLSGATKLNRAIT